MVSPSQLYRGPRPPPHHPAAPGPPNPAAAPAEWNAPDASSHDDGGLFGRSTSWQLNLEIRPPRGPFARRRHAHGENVNISATIQRQLYEPPPGEPRDLHADGLGVFAVVSPAVAGPDAGQPFVSLQATCRTTYDTWDEADEAADPVWAPVPATARAEAHYGGWSRQLRDEAGPAGASAAAAAVTVAAIAASRGDGGTSDDDACAGDAVRETGICTEVGAGNLVGTSPARAGHSAGRSAPPQCKPTPAPPAASVVGRSMKVMAQVYSAIAVLAGMVAVAVLWGVRLPASPLGPSRTHGSPQE